VRRQEETVAVLDGTIHQLESRNFTRGEGQADRGAIGLALARHMWDHTRVTEDDEAAVQATASTPPELRIEVMGSSDDYEVNLELDALARTLLSADGIVQQKLDEIATIMGETERVMMCMARVTRQVSRNGDDTGVMMKTNARFITSHPDLVDRHFIAVSGDRMVSAARGYRRRVEQASDRIPALAARRDEYLELGRTRVVAELTAGEPESGDES